MLPSNDEAEILTVALPPPVLVISSEVFPPKVRLILSFFFYYAFFGSSVTYSLENMVKILNLQA